MTKKLNQMHQQNFSISLIASNSDIAKKCVYKDDIEMNAEGLFYQDTESILTEVEKKIFQEVEEGLKLFFASYIQVDRMGKLS